MSNASSMPFLNDWSNLFMANGNTQQQQQTANTKDSDYYARLSAFLSTNSPGTLSSFQTTSPDTIFVPPSAQSEGDASSPEGSSGSSDAVAALNGNGKRKTSGDSLLKTSGRNGPIKDAKNAGTKANAGVHTHDDDGELDASSSGKRKVSTTDKRKEQNRNAQRAFRERREKHAKDLESRVAALEEAATEREQENSHLKDLVSRLQTENARLQQSSASSGNQNIGNSSFTFQLPASTTPVNPLEAAFSSFASQAGAFLPFAAASNGSSLSGDNSNRDSLSPLTPPSSTSGPSSLLGESDLFGDSSAPGGFADFSSQPLFTPNGEHLNPLATIDDILFSANSSTNKPDNTNLFGSPTFDSALSPGSTDALFTSYRDTEPLSAMSGGFGGIAVSTPPVSTPSLSTSSQSGGNVNSRSVSPHPSEPAGGDIPVWASTDDPKCRVFVESIKSLKGADAYDVDSLCGDMMKKATCKTVACHALEEALAKDMDVNTFFETLGTTNEMRQVYSK